jgi:hypothetical protein
MCTIGVVMKKSVQLEKVQARRKQIADEMLQIPSLVRGALTEQFLEVRHKGKKKPVRRGPYYVLSRSEKGRTRSCRIPRREALQVQREVANYKRFEALCEEFMELTERLGELEREADSEQEAVKKGLKSRSSRAGKSGV